MTDSLGDLEVIVEKCKPRTTNDNLQNPQTPPTADQPHRSVEAIGSLQKSFSWGNLDLDVQMVTTGAKGKEPKLWVHLPRGNMVIHKIGCNRVE